MANPRIPTKTIGSRLATWRYANHLTQQQLADTLCLHRESIAEIEAGRRKLTFVEANCLRVFRGLSFEVLTATPHPKSP